MDRLRCIVVAAVAVALLGAVSSGPREHQDSESQKCQEPDPPEPASARETAIPTDDRDCVTPDHLSEAKNPWAWPWAPIDAFTCALVIFTAGLAVVGWLQVRTTRALERPWLMVDFDETPHPLIVGAVVRPDAIAQLVVPYRILNAGKTPAWIVARRVHSTVIALAKPFAFFDPHQGPAPTYDERDIARNVRIGLPPDKHRSDTDLAEMKAPERQAFDEKRVAVLTWGEIQYRGIYGRRRTTGFYWVYTLSPAGGIWLAGHARYNWAT